jgi:hypothetical protein
MTSKDEVMRKFEGSYDTHWDNTNRNIGNGQFENEFVYTEDVNLRVKFLSRGDSIPVQTQSMYIESHEYDMEVYYDGNPVHSEKVAFGVKNGCLLTQALFTRGEFTKEDYSRMKSLNRKFTDVQMNFDQFAERDLGIDVPS